MTDIRIYLDLFRINSFVTLGAVIVGAMVATGINIPILPVFFGCIVAFLIVAGGFTINDYYDRDIDATNRPDKPIPSGKIKPEKAKAIGYLLLTTGIIISIITLPPLSVFIATTCAFLLDFYSRVLKRKYTIIGNFVTSYSTAITYVFGWSCLISVLNEKIFLTLYWIFIISLLACLGREFIKSIQDMKGDKKFDINNIAIKYGIKKAAFFATIAISIAIIFSPIPYIFGFFGNSYAILITIVDIIILYSCISLIIKIYKIRDKEAIFTYAGKAKTNILIAMGLGLFAFAFGLYI